ncbi:sensor histidine kinase [Desulfoferrobacter suflitae]|uniref:sensor histidine kinase n=1 Tax=Desulfoferrobacter suflitae TaxID=2865782 RepID=UPI0021647B52|nr:PAS domain-containing sensor histidine kinase [Desulfoferrobacter suflitae]MCK8601596.1 ATP-binding protein [Desulfoferrobacter suflitae]
MERTDYRKLYWKIITTTLTFSLVPLFALGATIYYQFRVSYTAKIMESLRTLTENRRNAIDLFFEERVSQLYTLAYTQSLDQLRDEKYLDQVFTLMQSRSKSFVDIGIIDRDGTHVTYVGPYNLAGVNYKNESWFHEVMLRGVYISDVFMGFRKYPHFIIAVLRREGDRSWILRATIDTEIFDAMVKAAQVGKRGDAYVVNREGILQTAPRFAGHLLGKIESPHTSQFSGIHVEEMQMNGETALFSTTWLKNKDWMLVIKEDPSQELTPLFEARYMMIGIIGLGVLVIVLGTVFVSRATVGQLIQSDREKAMLDASLVQSGKMAALGKLAAGIAHEVNNPLAVIKEKVGWMMDLLSEEDISQSENFKEFDDAVHKIDQHVERAKKVTHRLLGFARRMEPIKDKVDVNKLVDETIDFLENEAHYRNIVIQPEYHADLPTTLSDSSQLQQVVLNILNNAIDAIGKNGQIDVKTDYSVKDEQIVITISDNGPGIPNDQLDRIFDPFFTTKEVGMGTGLGLSISYTIVDKLGGRILVSSEVGKGTTFTIYLPVIRQEKA